VQEKSRRYWLFKSEPQAFSIQDLKASPEAAACWDGVRNYQARNLLRDEIKPGDGVLFYHSNIATPAVVGIAQVVRGGYPDHTARDPESEHYDPKASEEKPVWYMVDIRFVHEFEEPISREVLKSDPVFSDMAVLKKGSRLSIQPVRESEWQGILRLAGIRDPLA
jgi:predicted RNA-binding protein with PUA-like domain